MVKTMKFKSFNLDSLSKKDRYITPYGKIPYNDKIKFGKWTIDSLQLIIPIEFVDFFDSCLIGKEEYTISGSDQTSFKQTGSQIIRKEVIKGTYSDYLIELVNNYGGKEFGTSLKVSIRSDMLGSKYWEGITTSTIDLVFKEILSWKVFHLREGYFTNSLVYDVEYKKDIRIGKSEKVNKNDSYNAMRSIVNSLSENHKKFYDENKRVVSYYIKSKRRSVHGYIKSEQMKYLSVWRQYERAEDKFSKNRLLDKYMRHYKLLEVAGRCPEDVLRFEFNFGGKVEFEKYLNLENGLIDVLMISELKVLQMANFALDKIFSVNKFVTKKKESDEKRRSVNNFELFSEITFLYIKNTLGQKELEKFIEYAKEPVADNNSRYRRYLSKYFKKFNEDGINDIYFVDDVEKGLFIEIMKKVNPAFSI